jgi:hypothetical protein
VDIEDQTVESQIDQIIERIRFWERSIGNETGFSEVNPAAEAEADAKVLQELCEWVQKDVDLDNLC